MLLARLPHPPSEQVTRVAAALRAAAATALSSAKSTLKVRTAAPVDIGSAEMRASLSRSRTVSALARNCAPMESAKPRLRSGMKVPRAGRSTPGIEATCCTRFLPSRMNTG